MRLEDQAGAVADRLLVVPKVRAVGGADLDQAGAGARHDVGQPERAADLDQLAARHDRILAGPEGVEHQQHGSGVVVDDGRVLGAGKLADQAAHMVVALAARRAADVEFERHGRAHGVDRSCDRALGKHGSAEVGMQHRAGQVEHAAQARGILALQQSRRLGRHRGCTRHCGHAGACDLAKPRQRPPDGVHRGVMAVTGCCHGAGSGAQHLVDRWQPDLADGTRLAHQ